MFLSCLEYIFNPGFRDNVTYLVKSAQEITLHPEEIAFDPTDSSNALSNPKVITLTNAERAKENLALLTENKKLDTDAELKLQDLFKQQYFDHISPQGNGPSYLADQVKYAYVVIGENLALGNFKDNESLIAAWMASPGHRANILNAAFKKVGIGVIESSTHSLMISQEFSN